MNLPLRSAASKLDNKHQSPFLLQQVRSEPAQSETQKAFPFSTSLSAGIYDYARQISAEKADILLEKYLEKSSNYKEEGFTQQASSFLVNITCSEKISKDVREKYSFYSILVSMSKIFMLNEYEIAVLACALDHCDWDIRSIVTEDEEKSLVELPFSAETSIQGENRGFVIYLMVVTFAIKVSCINGADLMEIIQTYCQTICKDFQKIMSRASILFPPQKLNFSMFEINTKFCDLCKRADTDPALKSGKDYNMMANRILLLARNRGAKSKEKSPQDQDSRPARSGSDVSDNTSLREMNLDEVLFSEFGIPFEEVLTRQPSIPARKGKRGGSSKTFEEENIYKKVKPDNIEDNNTRQILESSFNLDFEKMDKFPNLFQQSKRLEPEDFLNINVNEDFLDNLTPNQESAYPYPTNTSFFRLKSDENKE